MFVDMGLLTGTLETCQWEHHQQSMICPHGIFLHDSYSPLLFAFQRTIQIPQC